MGRAGPRYYWSVSLVTALHTMGAPHCVPGHSGCDPVSVFARKNTQRDPPLPHTEHTALGDIFNELGLKRRDTIPTIMPVIYI